VYGIGVAGAMVLMSDGGKGGPCKCCERERRQAYDGGAPQYDKNIEFDEWLLGISGLRRRLLKHAKGRVLEVAAGTGRNVEYYDAKTVQHVVATDCSTPMLKEAEIKAAARSQPIAHSFETVDVEALPEKLEAASFDTVVDTFGLCSFEDPVKGLGTLAQMCKPDGKILLLEHGRGTWDFINNILDNNAEKHAQKWGCIYNRDIASIVESAGLRIVDKERRHFGNTHYYLCKPLHT